MLKYLEKWPVRIIDSALLYSPGSMWILHKILTAILWTVYYYVHMDELNEDQRCNLLKIPSRVNDRTLSQPRIILFKWQWIIIASHCPSFLIRAGLNEVNLWYVSYSKVSLWLSHLNCKANYVKWVLH